MPTDIGLKDDYCIYGVSHPETSDGQGDSTGGICIATSTEDDLNEVEMLFPKSHLWIVDGIHHIPSRDGRR